MNDPANLKAELQRLESAKWHPSSLGEETVLALFADDLISVEYGADLQAGVSRKAGAKVFMSSPQGKTFFQFLDQIDFVLSDWKFIPIGTAGVIISYHVAAASLGWKAFVTSIWTKREDRWQTVFYQASNAE